MNIKSKYIERCSYIWTYSAVVIFLLGFLKWYIAVPAAAATLFALFLVFRKEKDDTFYVSKKSLIVGAVIVVLWMIMCGQGGFVQQANDWNGRNAQLEDLIFRSWPVYYSNGSAFTYYIGHFMVPALFGKMFGLAAARAVLMIYTSLGVYAVWLYLIKILRAESGGKQMIILLLLVFFGNAENLRIIVMNLFNAVTGADSSAIRYGFTPNFNAFSWAFNQVTYAFIAMCMLFDDDTRVENFMVIGVPMLLFSPFMLCGVFVLFAVAAVKQLVTYRKNIAEFAKKVFSIQNLCVLVLLFPVIFAYLSGNIFADKPEELGLQIVSGGSDVWGYLIFVLCEFLLFSICVFPRFKKNAYFYAANIILLILPFFQMGLYNDLVTRVSSVGLFVLMVCVSDFLLNEKKSRLLSWRKILICIIAASVAIPFANSCIDATKNISSELAQNTYEKKWALDYKTLDRLSDRFGGYDLKYNFYTFDAKEHFFFKYMARN